jgi:hypothetical protein
MTFFFKKINQFSLTNQYSIFNTFCTLGLNITNPSSWTHTIHVNYAYMHTCIHICILNLIIISLASILTTHETLVMQKIRKVFTFDGNPYVSASQFVPWEHIWDKAKCETGYCYWGSVCIPGSGPWAEAKTR